MHQLDPRFCRDRQQRLMDAMREQGVDQAILVSAENIQYLTGFRPHRLMQAALRLDRDGVCSLASPNAPFDSPAVDQAVSFEAQWCATLRQEQHAESLAALARTLPSNSGVVTGVEFSVAGAHLVQCESIDRQNLVDLDATLWRLRRRKDPDELQMIATSIDCTRAMYERARAIIEPGISELEVFSQLQAAAVEVAGEPLTATGNDYQCNSPGGPPRTRLAENGELYILDLGPCVRGYYADNCRTIAVNRQPTQVQTDAWTRLCGVLDLVASTVRPGVSCRKLFEMAQQDLDAYRPGAFTHHLGHGFGLFPHEAPHLNPNWDDVFEAGDVFTAEPGLYFEELKAGIRLEQNFRVTDTGVELLTTFPLDLVVDH